MGTSLNRISIAFLSVIVSATHVLAAPSCSGLRDAKLAETSIDFAQPVTGSFMLGPGGFPLQVPSFCRVAGTIRPTTDSDIRFEVWLPETKWNGKFRAAGNGGFAGSINYPDMAAALRDGYATASTDTGHSADGINAGWALGHPEKIIDFGYRAIHETTEKAKAIIQAYYGEAPKRSYFASCSNGGRQALMEAQRYPADFDGILAGAPANYWTHLVSANFLYTALPMLKDSVNFIPPAKIPAISQSVLAACDAIDGERDGIITDPRKCHFDPGTMICHGKETDSCLTSAQATELQRIYAGAKNPQGVQLFPGYSFGGEDGPGGWSAWITGPAVGQSLGHAFSMGFLRDMVFQNPNWDPLTANLGITVQTADDKMSKILNATDADLAPFAQHGGKLIIYHGWSDAAIPALNTIDYYNSVVEKDGPDKAASFLKLYLVPAMQHCAYGPGPNLFGQVGVFKAGDSEHDIFTALDTWVENGTEPKQIIATKYTDDNPDKAVEMTRPICPYPLTAKFKGSGDSKDAANYACSPE